MLGALLWQEMLLVLFTGEHDYTIDAKGRLAIPPDVRAAMEAEEGAMAFFLTLGSDRTLCLYPEKVFHRLVNQIEEGLVTDEAVREFDRLVFPLATRLEIDAAGRVRLPDRMLSRARLTNTKITLIGVRDHLEIRDREQWESEIDSRLDKQAEIFDRFARRRRNDGAEGER